MPIKTIPFIGLLLISCHLTALAETRSVSGLGRLEPDGGVIQVAGSSSGGASGSVIRELTVAEG